MASVARCGFTIVVDGEEEPCDREATGWRWYQGHDHEDMLDEACWEHENVGGNRMHAAEAEVERLENNLSALLCDLTGGRLSKTTYDVGTMAQAIEEYIEAAR